MNWNSKFRSYNKIWALPRRQGIFIFSGKEVVQGHIATLWRASDLVFDVFHIFKKLKHYRIYQTYHVFYSSSDSQKKSRSYGTAIYINDRIPTKIHDPFMLYFKFWT